MGTVELGFGDGEEDVWAGGGVGRLACNRRSE